MINVEYNQLDPLLRATGHPDGDVNCETGYSPFPGNINQVIFLAQKHYLDVLVLGGCLGLGLYKGFFTYVSNVVKGTKHYKVFLLMKMPLSS